MKIIVIHGDYEVEARKRLHTIVTAARNKSLDIRNISSESSQFLSYEVSSRGLFKEELFVVENPGRFSMKELNLVFKKIDGPDIVFYQSGFLPKGFLNALPKDVSIEVFKLPKTLYRFIDSFYPKNAISVLTNFHSALSTEPPELILYLLVKQLRDLYLTKVDGKSLVYPDWRILKLKGQAEKFSLPNLSDIIKRLAEIDIAVKTSKESLISSLDLLIVTDLE